MLLRVLSVTRYRPEDPSAFQELVQTVLESLIPKPGFVRGRLSQNLDEPGLYQLVLEFDSVGAYRRAWSDPPARMIVLPLLLTCVDEPSAFADVLLTTADGGVQHRVSDLAGQ